MHCQDLLYTIHCICMFGGTTCKVITGVAFQDAAPGLTCHLPVIEGTTEFKSGSRSTAFCLHVTRLSDLYAASSCKFVDAFTYTLHTFVPCLHGMIRLFFNSDRSTQAPDCLSSLRGAVLFTRCPSGQHSEGVASVQHGSYIG